jgi:Homeodomain-like domain
VGIFITRTVTTAITTGRPKPPDSDETLDLPGRLVALLLGCRDALDELRYRAVMAVLDGAAVTEVAAEAGMSRQSVHAWVARYRTVVRPAWRTARFGPEAVRIRAPSAIADSTP